MFGIDFAALEDVFIAWLAAHGIRILIILIIMIVISRFSAFFIEKIVRRTVSGDPLLSKASEVKREDTLIKVFNGTVSVLIWLVGGMMILTELGIAVGPLLAAAGVAGLAFGFGGQYLIRDIISGLFIIFENQYRIGDVVCIGGQCGAVEAINLRLTVIRDLDGTVHHVPNGEIKTASNLTKAYSRININVGVSYTADLEEVISIVNAVGEEMANDPEWKEKITKAPVFLRVEDFADSSVVIKILGDTEPGEQWAVAGEYRKRLKIAFDAKGIELPFPQRVVHMQSV